MGLGRTLECCSRLLNSVNKNKKKNTKKKQLQTVELKVRMDCEGCELKIKKALFKMKGAESVVIDRKRQKVTVTGYVEAREVLKKVRSTGKKAELWPYVPYNAVAHAFTPEAYDKKAPPGHVKNVEALPTSNPGIKPADELTTIFSDDNPKSCSIM
ncbi:hypothetical protein MRB53_021945 [Persea americana]|uniref:Uncharacterized protein n=1 Tax=Persea americana TaxID=3435 RepID=A0ACC2L695_PERAE|nr:hypothetical protein MRB53_021945 [Persea americana]|eukprot:TRINITY_DN14694_c5_g1_i1.p1 TRINITY_DN14694_c5_g1~~TRINITY_DN14694_c5_g1_i1.p1  ORF type:complete len:156 (-),score=37.33 TRINITY_DN14694_c5_g1_i1:138-605(-)